MLKQSLKNFFPQCDASNFFLVVIWFIILIEKQLKLENTTAS